MQKTTVFLAIVTGAFVGCFGIALGTLFLQDLFLQSILLGIDCRSRAHHYRYYWMVVLEEV